MKGKKCKNNFNIQLHLEIILWEKREEWVETLMQYLLNINYDSLTTDGCPLKSLSIVGEGELLGIATVIS